MLVQRPMPQILDEADLIYRLHWAVRDADLNGRPIPPALNQNVVIERYYALNWLMVPREDPYPWDEVPTSA